MTLPRRTHYSISEVTQRWGTSMTDMRCYLETGQLQAQVLLETKHAQIYHCIETPDKEEAWVKKSVTSLNGYVVVQPEQIRKIFRLKSAPVHKFKAVDGPHYYKLLHEKDTCTLGIDDLWIAGQERDRFEKAHSILSGGAEEKLMQGAKTGIPVFTAGRPSIMKRITQTHMARVANGEALPTMTAEAQYLRSWARSTMPGLQIPSEKTILNKLTANAS